MLINVVNALMCQALQQRPTKSEIKEFLLGFELFMFVQQKKSFASNAFPS